VAFRGTDTWSDVAIDVIGGGPGEGGRISFPFGTWTRGSVTVWAHKGGTPERCRLDALRDVLHAQNIDLFEEAGTYHRLVQDDDGTYRADLPAPPHGGDYTIEATASGYAQQAKTDFDRATMATVAVI